MTAAVLADTGPLYALADPSDQYHARARRDLAAITVHRYRVLIGYPVLCEAHTLVLRRLGHRYSRQWLAETLAGTHLVNPDPGDYLGAVSRLERLREQPITLVDAVTAVLADRLEVPVWSFDRHFSTMGSARWP